MASSPHCFFIVSMALMSQFLVGSASALRLTSTTYIDKLCSAITNESFCLQTLNAYPPAVSAKGQIPLANAVILGIVLPQAKKAAKFAADQKDPTFKKCHDAYEIIQSELTSSVEDLKVDPMTANYDVMVCYDQTKIVIDLIGKKQDPASKTLMQMTMQMEKLIHLCVGATNAVGG